MAESFGTRLRNRREAQAISLRTIADQTKIKMSLLEALERDDVSHWPSGIFRRAYMRAYAHAIGLDPDAAVREFLQVHPEPAEVVQTIPALAAAVAEARGENAAPTRLRNILDSAFGSLGRLRRGPEAPEAKEEARAADAPRPEAADERPVAPAGEPAPAIASREPDLLAVARLCTELGRVASADDLRYLLREAAAILDARGLIVWLWDAQAEELTPALVHGYSDRVLAQLPAVTRDSDNATAAAFRSTETCLVTGSEHTSGALAVPLLTAAGCGGVLALELQHGAEQDEAVCAVAGIFAALLAQLVTA